MFITQNFADYGVDWDSPCPVEVTDEIDVVVPATEIPINENEEEELRRLSDPLRDSLYHGVDIYIEVLSFLNECIQNNS